MLDRLTLSEKRRAGRRTAEQIASLSDPVGEDQRSEISPEWYSGWQDARPTGLCYWDYLRGPPECDRWSVAALCIKSGNAAILRGGSEAIRCNRAIAALVHEGLAAAGLPANAVQVVDTIDRAAVGQLITMREYVDVIVPRGGKGLISRSLAESRVPMIQHLDGNCHVYVDDDADAEKALSIVENSKTQRYGTCNTAESLSGAARCRPFCCRLWLPC